MNAEKYAVITSNTSVTEPMVVKGKARVDAFLTTVLRSIRQTDDYAKASSVISAQLLDLWMTRINVNAVFSPPQKDAIKLPRLCESDQLRNLYVTTCLQVLMEMVGKHGVSDE